MKKITSYKDVAIMLLTKMGYRVDDYGDYIDIILMTDSGNYTKSVRIDSVTLNHVHFSIEEIVNVFNNDIKKTL